MEGGRKEGTKVKKEERGNKGQLWLGWSKEGGIRRDMNLER